MSGASIHIYGGDRHCDSMPRAAAIRGEKIDRLIAAYDRAAPWHTPLFRAARDGRITLGVLARGGVIRVRELRDFARPSVVLVSDDDERPSGPDGWVHIKRLRRWAAGVFVHAAAGEPQHYETIIHLATAHGRLLLAETSSARAEEWRGFAADRLVGAVLTRPGAVHPATPGPGELQ